MTKFYHLHSPKIDDDITPLYGEKRWLSKYKLAEWGEDTHKSLGAITCPVNPQHNRAADRASVLCLIISTPYFGDFTWTWQDECIITDRVLNLFRQAQFTGFNVRPVIIERINTKSRRNSEVMPKLWELVHFGKGGDPLSVSGVRLIYKCPACGLQRYSSYSKGLQIDKKQWDGSDFFSVNSYPKLILVSERVKDFIITNNLNNCFLTPSEQMVWPSGVIKPEEIYPYSSNN